MIRNTTIRTISTAQDHLIYYKGFMHLSCLLQIMFFLTGRLHRHDKWQLIPPVWCEISIQVSTTWPGCGTLRLFLKCEEPKHQQKKPSRISKNGVQWRAKIFIPDTRQCRICKAMDKQGTSAITQRHQRPSSSSAWPASSLFWQSSPSCLPPEA